MTTSCDADMKATATASSAKARVAPRGRGARQQQQRGGQGQLRQHQPAAPPAEQRQVEAVHQRRPQELEGVGQADQAEEADRRHVQAFHAEPGLHRLAGQRQRQAGSEAQHQHHGQPAPAGQTRCESVVGRGNGRRHRGILGSGPWRHAERGAAASADQLAAPNCLLALLRRCAGARRSRHRMLPVDRLGQRQQVVPSAARRPARSRAPDSTQ